MEIYFPYSNKNSENTISKYKSLEKILPKCALQLITRQCCTHYKINDAWRIGSFWRDMYGCTDTDLLSQKILPKCALQLITRQCCTHYKINDAWRIGSFWRDMYGCTDTDLLSHFIKLGRYVRHGVRWTLLILEVRGQWSRSQWTYMETSL